MICARGGKRYCQDLKFSQQDCNWHFSLGVVIVLCIPCTCVFDIVEYNVYVAL
jgi:hypothetical protein